MEELTLAPTDAKAVIGAACTLDSAQIPARVAEWASLRERAARTRPIPGGMVVTLDASEPLAIVADLVAREATCCGFYAFTLRVNGEVRELRIEAGEGREAAVEALLGL
jgi:hypothetical protein